ncbi:MAG: J domain-containing protein [Armatimonadetes bacterium]|nr:J domain-containing protein [Armatimonadota bacterium]
MSTAQRAYNLLRGYVNREIDRIRDLDLARKELEDSGTTQTSIEETTQVIVSTRPATPEEEIEIARKILGVEASTPFEEIRKAYDRLNVRSDPTRFPEGSEARYAAAELNGKVNLAYRKLTEDLPSAEKRFRSLEID